LNRCSRHITLVGAVLAAAAVLGGCSGGNGSRLAATRAAATSPPTVETTVPPSAPLSPSPAETAPPSGRLAGKVIVLDPGHNGGNASHPAQINQLVDVVTEKKACDTAGSQTADGYAESAYNLDVSKLAADLLRAQGASVILTRTDDNGVGPCITERAAIGNNAHADAAISIHADGGPVGGRGFHVIQPAPIYGHNIAMVPASDRLAVDLRRDYQSATGLPFATYISGDGLVIRNDLGGLNLSTVPKVFIETGNMRNPIDAALLESSAFRQRVAQGIVQGLVDFLAEPA
jgi:N-acetylmuramoyl-L-alanine amidase